MTLERAKQRAFGILLTNSQLVGEHGCALQVCQAGCPAEPRTATNVILRREQTDMDENKTSQGKTEKPSVIFGERHEVVIDSALSKEQKMEALDALEQDARQLSVASAEGMIGGEPSKLHDVLDAKDSLEMPPIGHAYGSVLSDLRSRLKADVTGDTRDALEKALEALDAVVRLSTQKTSACVPTSGTDVGPRGAEIDDEVTREKLDP
jgi:hypothetical protein